MVPILGGMLLQPAGYLTVGEDHGINAGDEDQGKVEYIEEPDEDHWANQARVKTLNSNEEQRHTGNFKQENHCL